MTQALEAALGLLRHARLDHPDLKPLHQLLEQLQAPDAPPSRPLPLPLPAAG